MDLRSKNLSREQLGAVGHFIVQRKMAYQPFIFAEGLEVGEGLKFHDGEAHGGNVYWEGADPRVADLLVSDKARFRACNACLRSIYEYWLDELHRHLGDLRATTVAEFGCNTGYSLFGLALRGAQRCIGFDFTQNDAVFRWFNAVLGTQVEFRFAEWDSLAHTVRYADFPEVDLVLSTAVTCHLPDPLAHLAFLCEHARQAVFIWAPVNDHTDLSITFGAPAKYPNALSWPISLDNDVRLSVPLLRLALCEAGFDTLHELPCPEGLPEGWQNWYRSQKALIGFRTRPSLTALGGGTTRRPLPADVSLATAADSPWNSGVSPDRDAAPGSAGSAASPSRDGRD
jgi:SAM-dependent methyltransferase